MIDEGFLRAYVGNEFEEDRSWVADLGGFARMRRTVFRDYGRSEIRGW